MLEIDRIEAGYGDSKVLYGVSFTVEDNSIVSLLGRNGMGKTTTIKAIMGLVRPSSGSIRFNGKELCGAPPFVIAKSGIGLVPEGRQVFPTLSVEENLIATAVPAKNGRGWTLERVYELFPRLAERRNNMGNQVSGGEQQMVAIGRALMTNPKLLVLDEATEGLAPIIADDIWACLERIKADGQSLLIVDKNISALTRFADRHVILQKGQVVWQGDSSELEGSPEITEKYLLV